MGYPQSYHTAVHHLVAFGAWRFRLRGRAALTQCFVDLRRAFGHRRACAERRHLLYISGMFPPKHTDPRYRGQSWAQPDPEDR